MTSIVAPQAPFLADAEVWQFLAKLSMPEPVSLADEQAPPWFEPGEVSEISQETYFDFLELFRPRWRHGSVFAVGEASGPLKLFWRRDGKFFGRQLTDAETDRFHRLSNISLRE